MTPQPRYRIAQLSDLHLGPLPPRTFRDLASKRILGYLSWRSRRHLLHKRETLEALVADIREQKVDHIAVTGDLINIGLPEEYELALAWLQALGPSSHVSVIPGNHDAYVAGSVREGWALWRPYMVGADAQQGFPWMRSLGDLVLFGVSTAIPTGWGFAFGRIGSDQLASLAELMAATPARKARVVLLHHPPVEGWSKQRKALTDAFLFRAVLQKVGADLVLCGHEHRLNVGTIPGPKGPIRVLGAPSASTTDRLDHPGGGYLLHDFTEFSNGWRVTTVHRRLKADGGIASQPIGPDPMAGLGSPLPDPTTTR